MATLTQILGELRTERNNVWKELTRIEAAIRTLQTVAENNAGASRPRRKMSAAARRKIAAAQRARWAKLRRKRRSGE